MPKKYGTDEYLSYLAEKSCDVFWVRSADYSQQIYLSPIYEKVWGRPPQIMYENPDTWCDYLHPEDWARMEKSLGERDPTIEPEKEIQENYRIIRPDGEIRWIKDTSFPIFDEGKLIGFAGIARDVTEAILNQKKLRKSLKEADAGNHAKSEFIANMSHDLRTPMAGVMGMLTELGHLVDDVSEALPQHSDKILGLLSNMKQFVKIAQGSSDELLVMFNDILEAIRLESGEIQEETPEHFNLWQVIKKNNDLLLATAYHKNLKLLMNVSDAVPKYLHGSRKYIDRILVNLLSNGLKFTEKGSVTVHASLLSGDLETVGSEVMLRLCVEDTGVGIPADKFEDIFGHFSRLTSSYQGIYKGSGLGLYAVKKYVNSMHGSIRVESVEGEGSRFIVEVPFTVSDHADKEEVEAEPARIKLKPTPEISVESCSSGRKATRILLTEDNLAAAMVVMNTLKRLGYPADHAKTGEKAVEMAASGDYSLIFMDVGLPGITGLEASKKIRALGLDVTIVALTGHVNKRDDCLAAGMQDLLIKPAQADALNKVLTQYTRSLSEKKELTIIDWPSCVAMCGDEEGATRKILRVCAEDLELSKVKIRAYYTAKNIGALRDELHKIRGGVCYLKLPELEHTLREFHIAVKGNPQTPTHLEETFQALEQAEQRFLTMCVEKGFIAE